MSGVENPFRMWHCFFSGKERSAYMNIGIIGSGNVGATLGTRWATNGHTLFFSTREPQSEKMKRLLNAGPNVRVGSVTEAVAASDILLLATPWDAPEDVLAAAGDLSGKILIDATNPVLPDLSGLALGTSTSAGEAVARWARGAAVVKAFNTVGANIMADPDFGARRAALFYCGDDKTSKQTVSTLIAELGFEPFDAGPLTQARLLEPFALLWITLALKHGYGREIAFEFLQRGKS